MSASNHAVPRHDSGMTACDAAAICFSLVGSARDFFMSGGRACGKLDVLQKRPGSHLRSREGSPGFLLHQKDAGSHFTSARVFTGFLVPAKSS